MSIASAMAVLAGNVAVLTASLARVDTSVDGALGAASTFRMVSEITPASRFVPRGDGPGPFDRSAAFTGLFDRITAADLAGIAGDERHVKLLTRLFERDTISGFGAPFGARDTFDFRATGGFDRVELRLIDLTSRARVGF